MICDDFIDASDESAEISEVISEYFCLLSFLYEWLNYITAFRELRMFVDFQSTLFLIIVHF